jgi:hypothetical protein
VNFISLSQSISSYISFTRLCFHVCYLLMPDGFFFTHSKVFLLVDLMTDLNVILN